MKMKIVIISTLFFVLLTGAVGTSAYASNVDQPTISQKDMKEKMDIDITNCSDATPITKEQAIKAAKNECPGYAAEATEIVAQKNYMTNKSFQMFSPEALAKNRSLKDNGLDNSPVWIVSFKGLTIYRCGLSDMTDDMRKASSHQEYDVVVDATSGETLFSTTFR